MDLLEIFQVQAIGSDQISQGVKTDQGAISFYEVLTGQWQERGLRNPEERLEELEASLLPLFAKAELLQQLLWIGDKASSRAPLGELEFAGEGKQIEAPLFMPSEIPLKSEDPEPAQAVSSKSKTKEEILANQPALESILEAGKELPAKKGARDSEGVSFLKGVKEEVISEVLTQADPLHGKQSTGESPVQKERVSIATSQAQPMPYFQREQMVSSESFQGDFSDSASQDRSAKREDRTVEAQVFDSIIKDGRFDQGSPQARALEGHGLEQIEHIEKAVGALIRKGGGSMRIKLFPPDLGRLHIHVSVVNDRVKVRFDVEQSSTQQLLVKALPELKGQLQKSGFVLVGSEVVLLSSGTQGERKGAHWGSSGGSFAEGEGSEEKSEEEGLSIEV